MPRDYYDVLGVSRNATKDDLKRAFRDLARKFHPDVNDAPDAEERFKEINEAYQVLSNDDRRAAYDRFGHAGLNGMPGGFSGFSGGFSSLDDILESLGFNFGFGFGGGRRRQRNGPTRGRDLHYNLQIDFEQAVFGAEVDIDVDRLEACDVCGGSRAEPGTSPRRCPDCNGTGQVQQVRQTFLGSMVNISDCPRCQGTGEMVDTPCKHCEGRGVVQKTRTLTVNIPAGVDDGILIRLAGQGEPGRRGGPPGDLRVAILVKPHEYFKRHNNDIVIEIPIHVAQAALGDAIEIPTMDGPEELVIPAGTQTGDIMKLRGKGVPRLRRDGTSSGRGDQLVVLTVDIPTRLTREQRELFEQLGRTLGNEVKPQKSGRSFVDRVADFFAGS